MSEQKWLKPVEALTRYHPPENINFGLQDNPDEFSVRYGYRVGQHGFLVKPNTRSEVIGDNAIHTIPLTAPFVRGMVNLRGNLVPVFDLNPLLSPVNIPSRSTNILVIGDSGDEVGLVVDDIPRAVYDTGLRGETPELPDSFHAYINSTISQQGTDWVEFDCQAFFEAYARRELVLV